MDSGTTFVVYKHSPRCEICRWALSELEKHAEVFSGIPAYMVNVLEERPISNHIAERTGIQHHSPQLLVFGGGRCLYHASHYSISPLAAGSALRGNRENA